MPSVCSIYDVDLRNLAEKHKLSAWEDLSGKVHLILADTLYNVWSNQNDNHNDYDVFRSNDM